MPATKITSMCNKEIFVFGSKIVYEPKRDAITSLPLELSWKIFSYLDGASLKQAQVAHTTWSRIILSHKTLRKRLNFFELSEKLGSKSLAKFYRRNKRKLKKERSNYLETGIIVDHTMKKQLIKSKRPGENMVLYTKRYKLY